MVLKRGQSLNWRNTLSDQRIWRIQWFKVKTAHLELEGLFASKTERSFRFSVGRPHGLQRVHTLAEVGSILKLNSYWQRALLSGLILFGVFSVPVMNWPNIDLTSFSDVFSSSR